MTSSAPAPPDPALDKLIRQAVKGDGEAFGELYARHLDAIYRYVRFRIINEADAEDMTEEVFVKAWEALPAYRIGEHPFTSWLYRIAHNLAVDYHRKRQPESSPEMDDQHGGGGHVEDVITHRQQVTDLVAAVQELDDSEQDVVILRFVEGYSHDEVAAMIGKSANATRVIQHRALAKLGKVLKEEGQSHG